MRLNLERLAQLSPVLVIGLGHSAARLLTPSLGAWAWLPVMLLYWAAMLACLLVSRSLPVAVQALHRPSGRGWWLAAVLLGLVPLPILIRFHALLRSTGLTVCWLLVATLNPFFEEAYWRGLLGEATARWPGWLACLYSSALFTASHPLLWGVFSVVNRRPDAWATLFLPGLLWSTIYRQRRSLKAAVVSHMLVDLGNLSVFAFLNLFPAGSWR